MFPAPHMHSSRVQLNALSLQRSDSSVLNSTLKSNSVRPFSWQKRPSSSRLFETSSAVMTLLVACELTQHRQVISRNCNKLITRAQYGTHQWIHRKIQARQIIVIAVQVVQQRKSREINDIQLITRAVQPL